jgi:copper chaperone CopZ
MTNTSKYLVGLITLLTAGLLSAPVFACGGQACDSSCAKGEKASVAKKLKKMKPAKGEAMAQLKIEGTKCGKCAKRIQSVLSDLDGVQKVVVSHKHKMAKVVYKNGAVSADSLKKAVRKAGHKPGQFKAKVAENS